MGQGIVIANFGGPRNLEEVSAFLISLLCDQEVIRSGLPKQIHRLIFSTLARVRAKKLVFEYAKMGGKSPIYEDTERLKAVFQSCFDLPIFTFHRYLPSTHAAFIKDIESFKGELLVFPLFPQFSSGTTGSVALFFKRHLPYVRFKWIKSYPDHPAFILSYKKKIEEALVSFDLIEDEVCLFYSFHGVPKKFILEGDPYEEECIKSFEALLSFFPKAQHQFAFQSKFGKGEWLKPYTLDLVNQPQKWLHKKNVLFVPLSFTTDHIETLCEIEDQYLKPLKEQGIWAGRVKALQDDFSWAIQIVKTTQQTVDNEALIRYQKAKMAL